MADTVPVFMWTSGPDNKCDWFNATWDVVDRYWTDPNMTADQAIAEFKKAHDAIF